jgi:hypothetical protein
MKDLTIVSIGVVLALLIILFIKKFPRSSDEGWYPTTTYVNTPDQRGIYPTQPNNWWGGNYYHRLNWRPWGYHRPGYYYRRGPVYGDVNTPINYSQPSVSPVLADAGSNPGAPVPYGNPVPLESIRWRGMFGPMLTSIKSPKDYYLGKWVNAGTAYTDNPNDFTYVDVEQLNLDPGRDLFSYRVRTKDGQIIPINLRQNHDRLEDGDRFKIQGMEGKGDFVFTEADKYAYVYT